MIRSCSTAIAVLLFLTPIDSALAALPGPPESYTETSADGRHLLVMIVPEAPDPKEYPWLVDTLRDTYSQSGCYELCSDVPLWTVDWFGDWCYLSEDGRYLVRCNPHPEEKRGTPWSWAVKFYDRGVEIGNYDLAELVDYPYLMMWGSNGWLWTERGRDATDPGIHEGRFYLRTSTREKYSFDITTGAIVEQHRFWRHVSTAGKSLLAVAVSVLLLCYFRGRKASKYVDTTATDRRAAVSNPRRRLSFSVRGLLAFTALCAMLVASFRFAPPGGAPQFAVFLTSFVLAGSMTLALFRGRNRSTTRRWLMRTLTFVCWLPFYVLSIGPALAIVEYFNAGWDVRMAVLFVLYYPLIWPISGLSYLDPSVVEWYFDAWRVF